MISVSGEAVIETRRLSKKFGSLRAVDGLDLKVERGSIFGFLGPNGAGKTTTIKMLMGLTKPSDGEVLLMGKHADAGTVDIRKNIGYLPERVAFYDNLTPLQTLHFFCDLKGADRAAALALLDEVGLKDAADRKVGTFSKGMTQLLGVAQAMIGQPSLYILDEPTSGLDPRWSKMVRDRIRTLNEGGATVIFSSHILGEVQSLCHRVAIIDRGRLVAEDTVERLNLNLNIKPRLELTIRRLDGRVPEAVRKIEGVEDAGARGDILSVTCEGPVRAHVIAAVEAAGLDVLDIKTVEPSLEEAFMKLVSGEKGAS